MRLRQARSLTLSFLLLLVVAAAIASFASHPAVRAQEELTEDVLRQWLVTYSNWGRWPNELGAANFITPKKRKDAARLVRDGLSVGLAHPVLKVPFDPVQPFFPQWPSIAPLPTVPLDPDNGNPWFHWMNPTSFTSDRYNVSYHGTAHSHLDALCHFQFNYGTEEAPDFRLFNGVSRPDNNTADGCIQLDITNLIDGIVTKGVLFDATLLPELREPGHPWLAPGTRVTREILERLETLEHVRVEPGDVILLYTGRWARREALGPWVPRDDGVAGWYVDTVPFMYERQVSFIGHDEWNDVTPGGFPDFAFLPVHTFAINVLGVDIFDNLDLERVAAAAKSLNRYEFMFTAAPSPVPGGTGSPLNPLATF